MADLCTSCQIQRSGCGCDGSLDDGCFLCAPEKHKRPPCPESCPNFARVVISSNALESVAAVLANPNTRERTDQEKAYEEVVKSAVIKDGHRQAPRSEEVEKHHGQRLYMVTTLARSARFGGKRTVAVCSTFEAAQEIVEKNQGDIFECSYHLAVIEGIVADWLYGGDLDERYWYVWEGTSSDGAYVPIEEPEAFANHGNIGGVG